MYHLSKTRTVKQRRQNANINITPMVDVMLVLLIVFMVAAPLMTVGVPVDLPKTQAGSISEQNKPVIVTVQKTGKLYLQEMQVSEKQLIARLRVMKKSQPQRRIFVRGDKNVKYGLVLQVMGRISSVGFRKVSLITQHVE